HARAGGAVEALAVAVDVARLAGRAGGAAGDRLVAAVDAGLAAVRNAVVAAGRRAVIAGVADEDGAVVRCQALLSDRAAVAGGVADRPAAVDVGLLAVFGAVAAGRRLAGSAAADLV